MVVFGKGNTVPNELEKPTINMSEVSSYEQMGNYGVGHMDGGEIKDNAKVAGKFEENNHKQSNKTNISVNVNNVSSTEPNISETIPNNNQEKCLFEIIIPGELTKEQKAKCKNVTREIEDFIEKLIIEKLSDSGIKYELIAKYVRKGSIKIGLEGHPEDFNKLQELFKSGQLSEILGIPVEDIALVVAENSDDDEAIPNDEKSSLVEEIRTQGAERRDLRFADLSDADLSDANLRFAMLYGANLSGAMLNDAKLSGAMLNDAMLYGAMLNGADLRVAMLYGAMLRGANLSNANLSGADLRGVYSNNAMLRGANLSSANLSGADLRGANLSSANLSNAMLSGASLSSADLSNADLSNAFLKRTDLTGIDLSGANVENTRFSENKGISESFKQDLIRRGAIFEDAPGDRSEILTRV